MLNSLELKIIPPLVALTVMVLMGLTSWLLPDSGLPMRMRLLIAAVWCVFGAVIALLGVKQFRRAKTTLHPTPEQTTSLVTDGIYRHTRNPMYLGMACVLLGFACFLGHIYLGLWVLGFVGYMTRFQIIPEERILAQKFPEAFVQYQHKVRRWI